MVNKSAATRLIRNSLQRSCLILGKARFSGSGEKRLPIFKGASLFASRRAFVSTSLPPVDDGAGQPGLSMGAGGVHDVGGLVSLLGLKIDVSDPALQLWEQETHALLIVLVKEGLLTTDELRRNIEAMQGDHYIARTYYCKWATSMALGLIERGVITYAELDHELLGASSAASTKSSALNDPLFSAGDAVKVKSEQSMSRWRKPHLRTPGYIFGVQGTIESYEGCFPDPSYKAFRSMLLPQGKQSDAEEERTQHLYRVVFSQKNVWPEGNELKSSESSTDDTVTVEIYEPWLVACENKDEAEWEMDPNSFIQESNSPIEQHHHHDHGHDHEHLPRAELEQRAIDLEVYSNLCVGTGNIDPSHPQEPTAIVGDRLSSALISLLSRPDYLRTDLQQKIRHVIDAMESIKVRADGATLIARAWTDPNFEAQLLQDAASAALELGIVTTNATTATKLKVVKSQLPGTTDGSLGVHNLITCTLCSCYPLSLLGLSPKWYKSRSYRARAVREPRAMLKDSFGLDLSPDRWTIRVHDSTADLRFIVLPPRPPNTEGWSEEDLRQLVSRDTMVGVALPRGCT
jgi:nitrile hydratase